MERLKRELFFNEWPNESLGPRRARVFDASSDRVFCCRKNYLPVGTKALGIYRSLFAGRRFAGTFGNKRGSEKERREFDNLRQPPPSSPAVTADSTLTLRGSAVVKWNCLACAVYFREHFTPRSFWIDRSLSNIGYREIEPFVRCRNVT